MKKYIYPAAAVLLFLSLSCGYNMVNENYTPPVQKNHPRLLYPKIAQERAFSGDIKAVVLVSKTGTVDKVDIIEPSGYNVLDNSAVNYCKSLLYTPAKRNGEFVPARVMLSLRFSLANPDWAIKEYVADVNSLYRKIENLEGTERQQEEREVFLKHNEFIGNMQDALNFNEYIRQVIYPNITDEWKHEWDLWPLSFLLYHDFIQRYPDYDSLAEVKAQLKNAVQEDLNYITNSIIEEPDAQKQKENTILKIKKFIEMNYPDITLNELVNEIKSKGIS
ncbi:MAG TPA: energy transducer TonB [Ignavibacteriaceae bacterium]|nr:energy transducer TonB [Ignavibacteriaceae bacterium]